MRRPGYIDSYKFNWETLDIMASGTSSLDAKNYLSHFKNREEAYRFLFGYGYDLYDPIENAEMFGNFQEAIQFIKNFFLSRSNFFRPIDRFGPFDIAYYKTCLQTIKEFLILLIYNDFNEFKKIYIHFICTNFVC